MSSGCDNTKKSVGAFKQLAQAWEAKVDKGFDVALEKAQKLDKHGYIIPTKAQQNLADMMASYNGIKSSLFGAADDIKQYLDTFNEKESQDIVRALNGDMDAKELGGRSLETYKRFRALIDKNADRLVELGVLDEKDRIKDYVRRFYKQHLDARTAVAKFLQDRKYARKNLTHEERIALGMIEDASVVIPRTLLEQRNQIVKAEFLKALADQFGKDEKMDGYVEIPTVTMSGGVKKYGALSGKWVPEEIKQTLDSTFKLRSELNAIEKHWYAFVDTIKTTITVKNPGTHAMNIASNLSLSALDGSIMKVGEVIKMGKEARDALRKELAPFGFDQDVVHELENGLVLNENKSVNIALSLLKNSLFTKDSLLGKAIRTAYGWEDNVFKMGAYLHLKEQTMQRLGRELTHAEKHKVYKEAIAPYANYATHLPGIVRALDKSGLSPFLHYVYKATPGVAKTILKHPLRAAILYALHDMFNNDEQDDDIIKPEWARDSGKYNLFGINNWSRINGGEWFFNGGRMVPGMKLGGIDLSLGFLGDIRDLANGRKPKTGYSMFNTYDTDTEKMWKTMQVAAENYMPSLTYGRYGQKGFMLATGQEVTNNYKKPIGAGEVVAQIFGFRKFDAKEEIKDRKKAIDNRLAHFLKKDPKNAARYNEEHAKAMRELREKVQKTGKQMPDPKPSSSKKIIEPIRVMPKNLVKLD